MNLTPTTSFISTSMLHCVHDLLNPIVCVCVCVVVITWMQHSGGKMLTLREQLSGAVTVEHRKGQPFYFRKLEDEQPPPLVEQPPPIVEQPPPQVEQPPPPRRVKRRAPEPPPPSPMGPPGSGQ
jgi:hypothetical protein